MKHLYLWSMLISAVALSQDNVGKNNLAAEGYDLVAYFENEAVKGDPAIETTFEGIRYRFSSRAHRETFLRNPVAYQPEYGGWCAYAMGQSGEKVEVNPKTFKIISGRLYLFYNKYFNNTLESWNKNERDLLKKADANWTKYQNG